MSPLAVGEDSLGAHSLFWKNSLVFPPLNSSRLQGETPAENTLEKSQPLWADCSFLFFLSGQFLQRD